MDISPAVDTPRKGDPITAEWAAQVASAANAAPNTPQEPGAFASPFGYVPALAPQNMLGANAPLMPFDCRIVHDSGTDSVYCYVPGFSGYGGGGYTYNYLVSVYGFITRPNSAAEVGTATNPWLKICDLDGSKTWVFLYFTDPEPESRISNLAPKWKISYSTGDTPTAPGDAWAAGPIVPLAFARPGHQNGGAAGGLVQLHRGFLAIGTGAWMPWNQDETANRTGGISGWSGNGECVKFSSTGNTTVKGLGNVLVQSTSHSTSVEVGSEIEVNGDADFHDGVRFRGTITIGANTYAPQTITDGGGNSVTVLAKQ